MTNRYQQDWTIWKNIIEILEEENVVLKNKLASRIHDLKPDADAYEMANQLQAQLVSLDEALWSYKEEIWHHLRNLKLNTADSGFTTAYQKIQHGLKSRIDLLKKEFIKAELAFENFANGKGLPHE